MVCNICENLCSVTTLWKSGSYIHEGICVLSYIIITTKMRCVSENQPEQLLLIGVSLFKIIWFPCSSVFVV